MNAASKVWKTHNLTALPFVQASKPAFVDIAGLVQREYPGKSIILVNSHVFEPELPLYSNVWSSAGSTTAPITLVVTTEVRPLTKRGAYLKTSNASTHVTDSLGVRISRGALSHFVIAPYFTRHTWNSLHSRRPYRICFVGCIIKDNKYRNAPSPGFEARKTFLKLKNFSSTRIVDLCERRRDRSPPGNLDSLYSQCDLCLATGGDSVTSVRLYDAMASLCLPIITDDAHLLPFASQFPWSRVAFRHPVKTQDDTDRLFAEASTLAHTQLIKKRHLLSKYVHMQLWNWNGEPNATNATSRLAQQTPARLLHKELLSRQQALKRGVHLSNVDQMLKTAQLGPLT